MISKKLKLLFGVAIIGVSTIGICEEPIIATQTKILETYETGVTILAYDGLCEAIGECKGIELDDDIIILRADNYCSLFGKIAYLVQSDCLVRYKDI